MSKFSLALFGFYLLLHYLIPKRNNVCKTFIDYNFPEENDNCYYSLDATLTTPEIIKKYAENVELHKVTTEDGYNLTMFRIPRKNPKGVILLHHSIATHSLIYLFQGNDSLAITLWRNGFDIWLANQRGTSFSDEHVNMTKHDFRYWNFSFHEMGLYDVSSELQQIRKETNNSKVIYFGHSLGGTIGLIYSSMKPEEAKEYLKDMILLSPGVYFKNISIFALIVQYWLSILQIFVTLFHIGSAVSYLPLLNVGTGIFTRLFPPTLFVVVAFTWILLGFTFDETDPTFFNYDAIIYLNNFSWKTLFHYIQMTTEFQMYDYGNEENLKIYGNLTPPIYPIEKISVPTLLITSASDALISQKDCGDVYERFSPDAAIHGHWKYSGLNHLDFLIGLHRKEIFADLMQFLTNVSSP